MPEGAGTPCARPRGALQRKGPSSPAALARRRPPLHRCRRERGCSAGVEGWEMPDPRRCLLGAASPAFPRPGDASRARLPGLLLVGLQCSLLRPAPLPWFGPVARPREARRLAPFLPLRGRGAPPGPPAASTVLALGLRPPARRAAGCREPSGRTRGLSQSPLVSAPGAFRLRGPRGLARP